MTSRYRDDLKMESSCCNQDNVSNIKSPKESYESVPLQDIRDMRHRDLSQDHMGKMSQYKKCKIRISSINIIEKFIATIFLLSSIDADSNDIMTMNDTTQEKNETWCARCVYDFNRLQENTHELHIYKNLQLRRT